MKRLHYTQDVRDATVHEGSIIPSVSRQVPIAEYTFHDSTGAPLHVVDFEDDGHTVVLELGPAVSR